MMEAEMGETVGRLSMFLPSDARQNILKILLEHYDENKLAKELGCTLTTLHKWKNSSPLPDEYMPEILAMALQTCPKTMDILTEMSEELSGLCKYLNMSENEKASLSNFVEVLDETSKEIVWYLLRNRHAGIRELADLINAKADQDVLTRVRDVINPASEEVFGRPMLRFEKSRIDHVTGEKILFSWWLEGIPLPSPDGLVDVFNEGDSLLVVMEMPGFEEKDVKIEVKGGILVVSAGNCCKKTPLFYAIDGRIDSTYKNGVLEIRLKKKW